MQFNIENKVGARFKLVAHKGDGVAVKETEWFHNIVLDAGLNRMSEGVWINRCCIGTGNSQPIPAQVALDAFLASTTTIQSTSGARQTALKPYHYSATVVWRFGEGVAAGNLSEIGLGWGDSNLWNRALIRDINGNPATITVLADEFLDVVSEVRVYPGEETKGAFNLLDKQGLIKSTHEYVVYPVVSADGQGSFGQVNIAKSRYGHTYPSPQGVNADPTSRPGDRLVVWSDYSQESSKPTPKSSRSIITYGLNQANGSHRSFMLNIDGLVAATSMNGFKLEISPPIVKTNTQIMTYTFEISWGRYEPT